MENNAKTIKELITLFKGKELLIEQSDTHYIQIGGDKEYLEKAEKAGILQSEKWEDEDEEKQ